MKKAVISKAYGYWAVANYSTNSIILYLFTCVVRHDVYTVLTESLTEGKKMKALQDKQGKPVESIVVYARRWFQKTYGNTYFTAQICVNGETVGELPYQYGYGNHYEDAAAVWLEKNGFIERDHYSNGVSSSLSSLAREKDIHLVSEATDVARKRDL